MLTTGGPKQVQLGEMVGILWQFKDGMVDQARFLTIFLNFWLKNEGVKWSKYDQKLNLLINEIANIWMIIHFGWHQEPKDNKQYIHVTYH